MTEKPFDPTKPVQTREGCKARILCSDLKSGCYPIVAAVTTVDDSQEVTYRYATNGVFYTGEHHGLDLVNIPEKHTVTRWVNVYRNEDGPCFGYLGFKTKEEAMECSRSDVIATVPVTIEFEV